MSGSEISAHGKNYFDEECFGLAQILLSFFLNFGAGLSDEVWLIKSSDQEQRGTGLGYRARRVGVDSCSYHLPDVPPHYLKLYSHSQAKGQRAGRSIPCSSQT